MRRGKEWEVIITCDYFLLICRGFNYFRTCQFQYERRERNAILWWSSILFKYDLFAFISSFFSRLLFCIKFWIESLAINKTLERLDVSYQNLSDEALFDFSHSLSFNCTLKCINLKKNNFGRNGLLSLQRGLKVNKTCNLIKLDNSFNLEPKDSKVIYLFSFSISFSFSFSFLLVWWRFFHFFIG